ncbi:MAG: hypothetical protein ACP5JG_12165 [Anaerolineae bacterium]
MAELLSFLSPLAGGTCAVRLQRLAAHSAFLVTIGDRRTKVTFSEPTLLLLEEGLYRVSFRVTCERYSHGLGLNVLPSGAVVFHMVEGRFAASKAGTLIRLYVRAGWPSAKRKRVLQVLWYVLWSVLLIMLLIGAFWTGNVRFWELAGISILALSLLYGVLFLFYGQAMAALDALLKQAMGVPSDEVSVSALPTSVQDENLTER